ncbi:uncharacterized protein A4U43_C07F340 [Asparagus officinalis]|uniref:Uncharacterized protein n=1 Tax=Asparagus officinalis TaxID=4686 RepID=A0A5P1E8D9_ASPOF|nr:uncharacterized protein A4U43_C07F340 [Asparagus officinalis]
MKNSSSRVVRPPTNRVPSRRCSTPNAFKTDTILVARRPDHKLLSHTPTSGGTIPSQASPFLDTLVIAVDNNTATATVHYANTLSTSAITMTKPPPRNATPVAMSFVDSLRSLNSKQYPAKVPLKIDHHLMFTVGLGPALPVSTEAEWWRILTM